MFLRIVSCRNHYNVPVTILQAYISLFHDTSVKERYDLLKYEIAKFVYCNTTNKTPNSFRNYFCKTVEHSRRVTRRSRDNSNLYIHCYRTNKLQRCIKYQGVKVWNSIPQKIRVLSYKRFEISILLAKSVSSLDV